MKRRGSTIGWALLAFALTVVAWQIGIAALAPRTPIAGHFGPLPAAQAGWQLLVDGTLPTEDLRELMDGAALPDAEEGDYHTLAGMCIAHFGRIPHVGEYFDWAGWRIEVVDLDGARIDKLLLRRLAQHDGDELAV